MATGESGLTPAAAADRTPPTFSTVWRGFDPDQVLGYLKRVAERVQRLETRLGEVEKERDEARRKRDIALQAWDSAKSDPYESMSVHVADLVRLFDEEVEKLRRDAQIEADRILAQAKSEAERTHLEAQEAEAEARAQADHIVRQARFEAEQIQNDIVAVHGSALNELRIIHDQMVKSIKELDVVLNGDRTEERVVIIDEADEGAPANEAASIQSQQTRYDPGM